MKTLPVSDYQHQGVERFVAWFHDPQSEREAVICLAMGMGKTRAAAACILRLLTDINLGAKILWLTHREELIGQSKLELEEFTGQHCDVEQAEYHATGRANLIVASVVTLRGRRLQNLATQFQPELIVCDEAHHALAWSWMQIKQTFPNARVLNLTATPYRSDVANRLDLGTVLVDKTTTDGICMGRLVPPRPVGRLELNLGDVKKRLGDYDASSLTELLCHPDILRASVRLLEEHGRGRKIILFAASVTHGRQISARLRETGFRVGEIYGDTPTSLRKDYYRDLREGQLDVLVNNLCLTEGFNLPALDMVAMFRPTRNAALYLQCIGRGLRRDPENPQKNHCLILDVVDTFKRKGGSEFPLPTEAERRIYSALHHRGAAPVEVFVSWFYRASDVERLFQGEITVAQCDRLDTPEKMHRVFALPWRQSEAMDARLPRIWTAAGKYSDLLQPFRLNEPEAFRLLAAHKGWVYLPHDQLPANEEELFELVVPGGWRDTDHFNYTVETLISRDAELRHFIVDLLTPRQPLKEQAAKCYDLLPLCPGGPKVVWFKFIGSPLHFIQWRKPTQVQRWLVQTEAGTVYAFQQDGGGAVQPDPGYVYHFNELPDFVKSTSWARQKMSEKQQAHVCRILSVSTLEAEQLRISKLSASALMSNHWHKSRLERMAGLLRHPEALVPAVYDERLNVSAVAAVFGETKDRREEITERFPAPTI